MHCSLTEVYKLLLLLTMRGEIPLLSEIKLWKQFETQNHRSNFIPNFQKSPHRIGRLFSFKGKGHISLRLLTLKLWYTCLLVRLVKQYTLPCWLGSSPVRRTTRIIYLLCSGLHRCNILGIVIINIYSCILSPNAEPGSFLAWAFRAVEGHCWGSSNCKTQLKLHSLVLGHGKSYWVLCSHL